MRIVLLGPPGAGKGTLAGLLKGSLKVAHVSTGDILREEIKKGTGLGLEAKGYIESGTLVPDELITKLVDNKLTNDRDLSSGFMLDGFPRTKKQAEDLDRILSRLNTVLDCVVYLDAEEQFIIQRLSGRRICKGCGAVYHVENRPPKQAGVCDACGSRDLYQRADDNAETVKKRLDVYFESTLPIVEYYHSKGILERMDGNANSEDLYEHLMKKFHADGKIH